MHTAREKENEFFFSFVVILIDDGGYCCYLTVLELFAVFLFFFCMCTDIYGIKCQKNLKMSGMDETKSQNQFCNKRKKNVPRITTKSFVLLFLCNRLCCGAYFSVQHLIRSVQNQQNEKLPQNRKKKYSKSQHRWRNR